MKKLLAIISIIPTFVFAVTTASAPVSSAPKAMPAAPIIDPCTPFKQQVSANFDQIQAYKQAGQDGKIPALHRANVAIKKAHPQCFEE